MKLGDTDYSIEQKRLREWLALNEILSALGEAAEHTDRDGTASTVCRYVSVALGLGEDISDLPWYEVATAFREIQIANQVDLSDIAFTRTAPKEKKEPWDYTGRLWWTWAHDFAHHYGWSLEYISSLDVKEAFSLLQECLLDEYFEREWQWNLSEYSLKYNQTTKKSEPNPLPKPDWMKMSAPKPAGPVQVTQIRRDMLVVGNVNHAQSAGSPASV